MNSRHATSRCYVDDRTRHLSRDGGFTLVEVIAVMVVLGIIALSVVPAMNSLGNSRSAGAARHMLADITYARQRALATGTTCWVIFDNGTWSVQVENPNAPGRANAVPVIDAATGKAHSINPAVEYAASIASVSFDGQQRIGFDWMGKPLVDDDTPLAVAGTVAIAGGFQVIVQPETGFASFFSP